MMDFACPLTWGLSKEETIKVLDDPENTYITDKLVGYGDLSLSNFKGDCGALCLDGANYATKTALTKLIEVASKGGFSKIFATVVRKYTSNEERDQDLRTRWRGWKKINKGKSNRNQDKDDIVLVRIIKKCVFEGYGW